ncbi:hypothetical protein [Hymenobacter fastidiosus]|uniref:hypothetical protein n=1 Tax=Hymenobacter fastidiosus TaxID=486264 RepID=UPI0031EB1E1B
MKKLVLCAVSASVLLQLTSCLNTEREVGTSRNADRVYTPPTTTARVTGRTVLNTVRAAHYFSNTKTKDNFILQLQGPKIMNGQARFIILNSAGDTLRKEVMPATALLDERQLDDPQAATVRDKEIAILRGMNSFFADDRFVQPAVAKTATQPGEVDAQAWTSVKADTRAVGFDYVTAAGKERRIAFDKKQQKAVVVAE